MDESVLVTVVMPNYNGQRFVEQAINCVLDQTYQNFELIVVDDKSTDDSPTVIEEIANRDARVKLIRNSENKGVAITRNIGIGAANGEYIALFDNDDLWEKDKLERQLELARSGYDIVYCSYDFIDENNKKIKKPFIVPESTDYRKMLVSSVISCSTCFIKAALMKAHPFNPHYYHEDYVLWMELLQEADIRAKGDKKVLMHYRQRAGSKSNNKGNAAKKRWNVYRKALGLNVFVSVWAFLQYALHGVIKYYF